MATTLLVSSCSFKHDTVSFGAAGKMPVSKTPVPKVEIETNTVVPSLLGGSVKSKKPYPLDVYYMDEASMFSSMEFSTLTVTYADGTNDPRVAALKVPMRIETRLYESYNSTSEGVVKNTGRIIQARFPGVISRDESFTLFIKGRFTKHDGTTIPFTINQGYDISRDQRTEKWAEFMAGI
ncbi:MAG: hypothetical protein ACKV19_25755 [Verrucomicrobiales bacterium]